MPENPLLPHRKLSELYLLMLRCRDLERRRRAAKSGAPAAKGGAPAAKGGAPAAKGGAPAAKGGAREAFLAATTMQLLPGDLLCGELSDETAEMLAPIGKTGKVAGWLQAETGSRLIVCAGVARGMTASATDGLVLALARAGAPETGWQQALAWAHAEKLPLVLLCEDAVEGGRSTRKDALTWPAMHSFTKKLRLPILAVDGEDAVAVYRVMQESAIRARTGCGPAILWAVTHPKTKTLSRSQQPVARLQNYLKVRNIALPRRP